MQKLTCFFLLGLLLFLSSRAAAGAAAARYVYAEIGNETYLLEVADTWKKRLEGLSNREKLGKSMGMLFIFDRAASYDFWMHKMLFPLDFIWLKEDLVVELKEKVPAPKDTAGQTVSFAPREEFDQVIELYAGEIRNSGVRVGDPVHFKSAD